MTIFKSRGGPYDLHSGGKSHWKIDCDDFTDEDWETLAMMVVERLGQPFRLAFGVPRGGMRLARALTHYESGDIRHPCLIVDDVLTTGASMEERRREIKAECIGAVVFARGQCPDWITPLFRMEVQA